MKNEKRTAETKETLNQIFEKIKKKFENQDETFQKIKTAFENRDKALKQVIGNQRQIMKQLNIKPISKANAKA